MGMRYRLRAKSWRIVLNSKRLGAYADLLSDELLARALKRCESEGVTVLMGAQ